MSSNAIKLGKSQMKELKACLIYEKDTILGIAKDNVIKTKSQMNGNSRRETQRKHFYCTLRIRGSSLRLYIIYNFLYHRLINNIDKFRLEKKQPQNTALILFISERKKLRSEKER